MVSVFQEIPTYIVHQAQMTDVQSADDAGGMDASGLTDWIEVDVRRSADGRLVVFHNERVITGERAGSLRYAELQQLGVQSLKQFIDGLSPALKIVLDVKNSIDDAICPVSETTASLAAHAAATIADNRSVLLTSFDPSIVLLARRDEPSVQVGLTAWRDVPLRESIPTAAAFHVDVLAVHLASLRPNGIELGDSMTVLASQVALAHRAGLQLACWGGQKLDTGDISYVTELGIDAIYIDEQDLMRIQVNTRKGH